MPEQPFDRGQQPPRMPPDYLRLSLTNPSVTKLHEGAMRNRRLLSLGVLGAGVVAVCGCIPTLTDPDGALASVVVADAGAGVASLGAADPDASVHNPDVERGGERSPAGVSPLSADGSLPAAIPLEGAATSPTGGAASEPSCDPARPQSPRPGMSACAAGQGCQPAVEEGGTARCVPAGASPAFQACEVSADCGPGLFCRGEGLCTSHCLDDSDCEGGVCRPFSDSPVYYHAGAQRVGLCTQRCDPVHPSSGSAPFLACPEGLGCTPQADGDTLCTRAGSGRNWASCTEHAQCAPGFLCDTVSNRCSQFCRENADCDSSQCSVTFVPPALDINQRELRACRQPTEGMPCSCGRSLLEVCPNELVCLDGQCHAPPEEAAAGPDAGVDTTCGVVEVSAATFPCALFGTGEVYCWSFRRLDFVAGQPVQGDEVLPPISGVVPLPELAIGLSAGVDHACALLASGEVWCWGDNTLGQLGRGVGSGVLPASATPAPVDIGGPAVAVLAAVRSSCALRQDGAVVCWGASTFGKLGNGQTAAVGNVGNDETPASVGPVQLGGRAVQIALGFDHACALLEDGAVRCWGHNDFGQLGYGHTENIGDDEPVVAAGTVDLPGRALQVTAGNSHSCALLEGGSVRCWGDNSLGQLGYGDTWTCSGSVSDAGAGDGSVALSAPVSELLTNSAYNCALLRDGSVTCWGIEASAEPVGCEELVAPQTDTTLGAARLMVGVFGPCVQLQNGEVSCWDVSTFGNALSEASRGSVRAVRRFVGPGALPLQTAPRCRTCE